MPLKHKLTLLFAMSLLSLTLVLSTLAIFSFTSTIEDQNAIVMDLKIKNILGSIQLDFDVLEESGLLEMENYVESTKAEIFEKLKNQVHPEGWFSMILDKNGKILASKGVEIIASEGESKEAIVEFEKSDFEFFSGTQKLAGSEKLFIKTHFKSWDWSLVIGVDKDVLFARRETFILNQIITTVVGLFAILYLNLYFSDQIVVRPIMKRVREVNDTSISLKESAKNMRNFSTALIDAATTQSSAIEETSASLKELTEVTMKNTQNSKAASKISGQVKSLVDEGAEAMRSLVGAMGEIESSNKEIRGLRQVIIDISQKIKIIDEIVHRTQLLSFNASIEASRAGAAGAGFSVVAE